MAQRLKGAHVRFLRQVTKLKSKMLREGLWQEMAAEKVLQGAGTEPIQTYLYMRQAEVTEWFALQPISDVCVMEKGYEGEG